MDNDFPISVPGEESKHRDYKAGHYYDGNHTSNPEESMKEGSMGLDYDQGQTRCAIIPEMDDLTMGQKNMRLKKQGSQVQIEAKI